MSKKKLSIIIPRHNEPDEVIDGLLSCIKRQILLDKNDVEVVISSDISREIGVKVEENLQITRVNCDGVGGPGPNRQNGLDVAVGDKILFIDADDMLDSPTTLHDVIQASQGCDLLHFGFREEYVDNDGNHYLIPHPNNITWVFGKVYDRKFLVDHNIRFSPDLLYHEDSYFNLLMSFYHPVVKALPINGYIWRYNENSITRANGAEYTYSALSQFMDAISAAITESDERGVLDPVDKNNRSAALLGTIFGYLQDPAFNNYSRYVEDCEAKVYDYLITKDPFLTCLYPYNAVAVNNGIMSGTSKWGMDRGVSPKNAETFVMFIMRVYYDNLKKSHPDKEFNDRPIIPSFEAGIKNIKDSLHIENKKEKEVETVE